MERIGGAVVWRQFPESVRRNGLHPDEAIIPTGDDVCLSVTSIECYEIAPASCAAGESMIIREGVRSDAFGMPRCSCTVTGLTQCRENHECQTGWRSGCGINTARIYGMLRRCGHRPPVLACQVAVPAARHGRKKFRGAT